MGNTVVTDNETHKGDVFDVFYEVDRVQSKDCRHIVAGNYIRSIKTGAVCQVLKVYDATKAQIKAYKHIDDLVGWSDARKASIIPCSKIVRDWSCSDE